MRTPVGRAADVVRAMAAMPRMVSKLLQHRDDLTHHFVRRLSRRLSTVQPALDSLGSPWFLGLTTGPAVGVGGRRAYRRRLERRRRLNAPKRDIGGSCKRLMESRSRREREQRGLVVGLAPLYGVRYVPGPGYTRYTIHQGGAL